MFAALLLSAAASLGGCAGAPKSASFVVPQVHASIAQGVRVVSDACVQRRVLLGANHFVIDASQAAAQKIDANVRAHLQRRALATPEAPTWSVCGVLNDAQNPQKTAAAVADGPTSQQPPPLKLSPALASLAPSTGLPSLLAELQLAAQRAAAATEKDRAAIDGAAQLTPAARDLAATLAAPHDALLYVGLSANSESGGKIAAQMTAIVGLSVVVAVAAAPAGAAAFAGPTAAQTLATQAVATAGVSFISIDGMLLTGALVDVRSGRIAWTHAVVAPIDAIKTDNLGRGITTDRLLVTLLNQPAEKWSPPGARATAARTTP